MELKDRVVVISEENFSKLSRLYEEVGIDDLSKIVNNHLKVVIDEIEEDCSKQKVRNCVECEYMRTYNYGSRIYYCDHADRIDDMGKLGVDHSSETSPEWCPLRSGFPR